jgi:hypothetical protein
VVAAPRKTKTVYKTLHSKRQGKKISLIRTSITRRRVRSLRSSSERKTATRQIIKDLRAWQRGKKKFAGKNARANIELRYRDGGGKIHSKWISFKRRHLDDSDEMELPEWINEIVSSYIEQGMDVLGFRSLEFEAARRPDAKPKTAKRGKKTKRSRRG